MHGSATYPFNVIFYTTRCTIDQINANKDAFFGGNMPAPTENTLTLLKEKVKNEGYDLGIGVDGDGDRLGVIDSNGEYISANDILVLLYYYLHEYKGWKGPVVRNLATTHLLDKIAKDLGEQCYEVPVGFKHISSKIDEVNAVLGGESSGGLTVRGHIHGKDSIYASALFVEMICKTGKTPSDLLKMLHDKYGQSEFVECNLRLNEDIDLNTIDIPTFDKKVVKVNKIDGTIISSVVPSLTKVVISAIKRILPEPLVVKSGIKTGLSLRCDNPNEVGSDIVCCCVGANLKYKSPLIIADLGTATKIIAINKKKEFIGCTIAPGVKTSTQTLVSIASQLPEIGLIKPNKVIGTNTPDCMNSGVIYGYACMIDGMYKKFEEEIKDKCTKIITGGLGSTISKAMESEFILDKYLIFDGLNEIYRLNK